MHKKVYPLSLRLKKRFCMMTSRNSGIYPEHEWESAAHYWTKS